MNKSPYLTDTVMIEAINKEDVLSPVMVKEVLVANPQSAKSQEVMTELDNRINPLPDYMIEEIEEGRDTIASKELMEASKSFYRHERSIFLNLLKNIYKFDSLNLGYSDSLINLLQNENTINAQYDLVFEHIQRNEFSLALGTLNNVSVQYNLDSMQLIAFQKYDSIVPVIISLYQYNNTAFELDSAQRNLLKILANDSTSLPGIYARNMLIFCEEMTYSEQFILPDTILKSVIYNEQVSEKKVHPPRLKVYPNPAKEYFSVEYNLGTLGCEGSLVVRDNLGNTVRKIPLNKNSNSIIINTSGMATGVYYFNLHCNNEAIKTSKVVVMK